MYKAKKIDNAIQDTNNLNVDIMGETEMRWSVSGHHTISENQLCFSKGTHDYIFGRIALQLNTKPVQVSIIQVYAPTHHKCDDEAENFHLDHRQTLRKIN